jgi:hypothetical protein
MDIAEFITSRWPNLKTRAARRELGRVIREVTEKERKADFPRTKEEINFDILVRVTQLYEIRFDQHTCFS